MKNEKMGRTECVEKSVRQKEKEVGDSGRVGGDTERERQRIECSVL